MRRRRGGRGERGLLTASRSAAQQPIRDQPCAAAAADQQRTHMHTQSEQQRKRKETREGERKGADSLTHAGWLTDRGSAALALLLRLLPHPRDLSLCLSVQLHLLHPSPHVLLPSFRQHEQGRRLQEQRFAQEERVDTSVSAQQTTAATAARSGPPLSLNSELTSLFCCSFDLLMLYAAVSEAETSHNLKGGESVEWKLRGSIHHGRIITKLTEPTTVNDSMVAASVKEPKWLGKRAQREIEERMTREPRHRDSSGL